MGYCFVNLSSPEVAMRFCRKAYGFAARRSARLSCTKRMERLHVKSRSAARPDVGYLARIAASSASLRCMPLPPSSRGGIAFARPSPAPSPRRSPLRRSKASASGQIARFRIHNCIYFLTVEFRPNEFCPPETCLPWWVVLLAPELPVGPAGAEEPPPHRPREPAQGAARREALQPSVPASRERGAHRGIKKRGRTLST